MSKSIEVVVRSVYGNDRIYPVSESAKIFARIAGTKTIKRETLELVKELGYEVIKVTEEVPL